MNSGQKKDCILCRIASHEVNSVIVYEDAEIVAIMDLYPATGGHILVLPKSHIEDIYAMPGETGGRIMAVAVALSKVIKQKLSPAGLNLIQSNEIAGGQTIPHFHLHIVPRYKDDQVMLKFGHGSIPADARELERMAAVLRPVP